MTRRTEIILSGVAAAVALLTIGLATIWFRSRNG